MGNQAALSGLSHVPRGCLSGAGVAVTVCKSIFDGGVYGSFRHTDYLFARMRTDASLPRTPVLFCGLGGEYGRLSCAVSQVATS